MTDIEKQLRLKTFRSNIANLTKNNKDIDNGIIAKELLSIKNDVASISPSVKAAALETLEYLANLGNGSITSEIIKLYNEENTNKAIQKCITKSLKTSILRLVNENLDILQFISPWVNQNVDKLLDVFGDACTNELSKRQTATLLISKIIPQMMCLEQKSELRYILIEVAFRITDNVKVFDLMPQEMEEFQKEIYNKYLIWIMKLRDQDYPNWHRLWIFIIKFCDKWIHSSLDLTNKLLRVVEFAFRNNSVNQRTRGYDCWKVLIDNASLDPNYISSSKQIKLLVTPLKAKFSKQVVVVSKRFNIFCHLLYKLQQKSIFCLPEFLDFCFGPVGDVQDPSKIGQGKTVPELWPSSTRMLMGIIGHTHPNTTECLELDNEISFEKPIINAHNFQTQYKMIIRSVRECSILLKDDDLEGKRDTVLKCMWLRIFELIKISPEEKRVEHFKMLSEVLKDYMQRKAENQYFEYILVLIALCLLSCDRDFISAAVQHFLPILLRVVLDSGIIPTVDVETLKDTLSHSFSTVTTVDSKIELLGTIMGSVLGTEVKLQNALPVAEFWTCVANELVLDLTLEQLETFENFQSFFTWPIKHLHLMEDADKKKIMQLWGKLYKKVVNDTELKKRNILSTLDQMFDGDSSYGPNILSILYHMSQAESKFCIEFVQTLMELVLKVLQNIDANMEVNIVSLLSLYFTSHCYKDNHDENNVKSVCAALKSALSKHKYYRLLEPLYVFLKASSQTLRDKFSSHIIETLSELKKCEGTKSFPSKDIQKVIQLFTENKKDHEETKTFKLPTGRSARIAHLGKTSPKSPVKTNKVALRLFGKDVETMSPLKVKGSFLNNSPQPKLKSSANVVKVKPPDSTSLYDENSSQFVPIDTEVKLQPQKMNEHQKEMLKKKREDIPALYQDLSQSQSQDIFSSKSNSNSSSHQKEESNNHDVKITNDILIEENALDELIDHFKNSAEAEEKKEIDPDLTQVSELESKPEIDDKFTFKDLNTKAKSEDLFVEVKTEVASPKNDTKDNNEVLLEKSKKRMKSELSKLQMDIVGADEFLASKRSRLREKQQTKDEVKKEKKGSLTPKPQKSNNNESTKNRRKTISELISVMSSDKEGDANVMKDKGKCADTEMKQVNGRPKIFKRRASLDSNSPTVKKVEDENNQPVSTDNKASVKRRKSISEGVESTKKKEAKAKNELSQESVKFKIVNSKVVFENIEKSSEKPTEQQKIPRSRKKKENVNVSTPVKTTSSRKKKIPTEEGSDKPKIDTVAITIETVIQSMKSPEGNSESGDNIQINQVTITKADIDKSPIVQEGEKRKNLEDDLGDFIESSQESCGNITNLLSTSKKQKTNDSAKNSSDMVDENKGHIPTFNKDFFENKWMEIEKAMEDMNGGSTSMQKAVESEYPSESTATNLSVLEDLDDSFKENLNQDSTITQDSTSDSTEKHEEPSKVNRSTQDTLTQTQDPEDITTQADMLSDSVTSSKPTVLYLDLPKKPQLTDSEQMMCRMDTMSICTDLLVSDVAKRGITEHRQSVEELEIRPSTPPREHNKESIEDLLATPSTASIPSSPITVETPSRTMELLDNTIDISPINSQNSVSDSDSGVSKEIPIAKLLTFQDNMEDLEDQNPQEGNNEDVIEETAPDQYSSIIAPENLPDSSEDSPVEAVTEVVIENQVEKQEEAVESVPSATEEVSNEVEDTPIAVEEEVTNSVENAKEYDIPEKSEITNGGECPVSLSVLNKLSNKNIIKRRLNNKRIMSPSTGRIKLLMSNLELKTNNIQQEDVDEEDILTFTREIPSPLAVPRMSILKRKLPDSPDTDGMSPCAKRKRVNFSDPCLTSKKIFIKDEYPSLEVKRLFDPLPDSKTQEEYLDEIIGIIDKPIETESEVIETEPSMEVTDPTMLHNDRHIYPALANCNEDVMAVLKKVTSPMLITTMWKKVQSSNIKTIGDLARLSEAEINRFPFKAPVVANVYKALDNYYKKKIVKDDLDVAVQCKKVNGFLEDVRKSPKASRFGKLGQKQDRIPQEEEPEPLPPTDQVSFADVLRRSSYDEIRQGLTECMDDDLLHKSVMPVLEDYLANMEQQAFTKLSLGFIKSLLEKR